MLKFASVWQPTQLMELLWQLEQRFPVATWGLGKLHVWPLVRIQIASVVRAAGGTGSAAGGLLRRACHSFISQQQAALKDSRHVARLKPADTVFLSSSACRSLVDGQWLDRLCDPLREQLEHRGYSCLHLELASQCECRIPRWRDSYLIQSDVLWRRLLCSLPVPKHPAANCTLEGLEEMRLELARLGIATDSLSLKQLGRQCALISSLAAYFKRILTKTQARQVITVCYYNKEGLSLNLAARQLGIKSVDLQHGVQGSLHFAYGPWTAIPPDGYELLPDRFWCWSEQDAAAINKWSAKTAPHHAAFCGGNTWAQYWAASTTASTTAVRKKFALCQGHLGGTRQILITLQPLGGASQGLAEFADSIHSAPPDWRWWIRLHPAMSTNDASLRAWLQALPAGRVEWSAASELPLPVILAGMDAHVTRSSSVVQEAAACGIASVVTDAVGISYYDAEAAAGMVQFARTGLEIISALEQVMSTDRGTCGHAHNIPWEQAIARLRTATGLGTSS